MSGAGRNKRSMLKKTDLKGLRPLYAPGSATTLMLFAIIRQCRIAIQRAWDAPGSATFSDPQR
jgi:hypothetical protein